MEVCSDCGRSRTCSRCNGTKIIWLEMFQDHDICLLCEGTGFEKIPCICKNKKKRGKCGNKNS